MTQPDLFEAPDSPSPRLEWMRRHGIQTKLDEAFTEDLWPWEAWIGDEYEAERERFINANSKVSWTTKYEFDATDKFAFGMTEDHALLQLAESNNLKLWNEG